MINKLMNKLNLTEKLAGILIMKLNSHLNKEGLDLIKMKLGLEIILINVTKLIIVIVVANYLNLLKDTLLMIVVFGSIRKSAFGLHAKSSMVCTISTLAMFVGGAYIGHNIKINNCMVFAAFLIMNLLLYKYAPADTENHPLLGRKLREILKKKTIITGIFIMIFALIVPSPLIKALITLAVSFAVINILPITYKILKRRYNNYEKFERAIN